jgi:hypothetical protein
VIWGGGEAPRRNKSTYMYTYIHTYMHSIHTCMHTYIHTYTNIHIQTYIYIYIYIHSSVPVPTASSPRRPPFEYPDRVAYDFRS